MDRKSGRFGGGVFAVAIAMACGLAAQVARGEPIPYQAPTAARTFTFRLPGEPETLDWNRAHTMVETYILMNLMEGLLTFDANFKIAPSLAQSFERSPDGRTYTFRLKPGVRWSDGVALKAKDFVYSWKRLLSPLTAASYAYFLYDIEGAQEYSSGKLTDFSKVGIKALDDGTFQVKLSKPVAHWVYIPTFWVTFPLREDIVQKYGEAWASPGRMVTLGPFTLNAHDIESKIILKANPFYHGLKGNIEQAIALIIKDDTTAMSLYESGKLDLLTDISTLDLKRMEGKPELKTFPYLKTGYLGFSHTKYPATDAKVRRAIAMAIDKSHIGEILHGGQQSAASFVPPGVLGHNGAVGLPYDPKRAKAELKAAGIDLVTRSVQVELLGPNWDKQLTLAQFIQNQVKKNLGIEVVIQLFDHKTFRAQLDLHGYPLFEGSWSADYPDPDNFMSIFLSNSGNNRTTWKSAKYDELVLGARFMGDAKSREKAYLAAQKILLEDDAVIFPLYYEPIKALVRGRVKGLEINPLNYLLLRKVQLAG